MNQATLEDVASSLFTCFAVSTIGAAIALLIAGAAAFFLNRFFPSA
jgi:hypothetical protein